MRPAENIMQSMRPAMLCRFPTFVIMDRIPYRVNQEKPIITSQGREETKR